MRRTAIIILAIVLILASSTGLAAETIYPAGYNHRTDYILSTTVMTASDTLVVERYLVNGEPIALDYLYFSDQLPSSFHVVNYSLTVNGTPNAHMFLDSMPNLTLDVYDTYHWVVSSPDPDDGMVQTVNPGDSVSLRVRMICRQEGSYELPLHTTVFSSAGVGFFATAASIPITVESCCDGMAGNADCRPDNTVDIGDVTAVINYLFIEQEDLCCYSEADVDDDGTGIINMGDLTALINYLFIDGTPLRSCP